MFKRIVVPLDGSKQAEQALSIAASIASANHATVVLLHAVRPLMDYGYAPHPLRSSFTTSQQEQHLERAREYLTTVSYQDVLMGVKVECVALTGLAAPTILGYTNLHSVDLIVMSRHGYTGLQRWMMGSVAQKIVHQSRVPVLLLNAGSPGKIEFRSSTTKPLCALVAVDDPSLCETLLLPTMQILAALAPATQRELHLIHIVKSTSEHRYNQLEVNRLEQTQQGVAASLRTIATTVSTGLAAEYGVKVAWSELVSDDIAGTLIKVAEVGIAEGPHDGCDVLIIGAHGRTGLQQWGIGSITERILNSTAMPLLVVRPQETTIPAQEDQEVGAKV